MIGRDSANTFSPSSQSSIRAVCEFTGETTKPGEARPLNDLKTGEREREQLTCLRFDFPPLIATIDPVVCLAGREIIVIMIIIDGPV